MYELLFSILYCIYPSDYPITNAGYSYYYSWSYYMSQYYTCTGTEATLADCSLDYPYYYWYCDSAYYDGAGVVCSQASQGMFECTHWKMSSMQAHIQALIQVNCTTNSCSDSCTILLALLEIVHLVLHDCYSSCISGSDLVLAKLYCW